MLRTTLFACLGWLLLTTLGCHSIPLFSRTKFIEADAKHPVMEVLCLWEPAEGRGMDNMPCRGFGGQVLFFSSGHIEPVKVEGEVRIYVFDEEGVHGDPSLPIHQFDFPAAAWNTFIRPSNLGASYQLFVPYTRKGMHEAACTMRVRFTPEGGLPVYSRLATVSLRGTARKDTSKDTSPPILAVSGSATAGAQSGIVTADWSEIMNHPEASPATTRLSTPGISMATHQQSTRQANTLNQLRQAADEANHASPTEEPPRSISTATNGLKLRPLHPSQTDAEAHETPSPASHSTESRDSSVPAAPKRRHPLSNAESE